LGPYPATDRQSRVLFERSEFTRRP
jgi:hypothetical protein